jgi:hypothetical protein
MIKQYCCDVLAITALLLKDDTMKQQRKRRSVEFTISLLDRKRKCFILYKVPVDNEVSVNFLLVWIQYTRILTRQNASCSRIIILWRRDRPIASWQLGKHIPAEAYARNNRTSIARQRISKQAFSTIERLRFIRGPCRGVVKGQRRSIEWIVVEKWVKFWRWQSKVTEKKWQEMN